MLFLKSPERFVKSVKLFDWRRRRIFFFCSFKEANESYGSEGQGKVS